MVSEEMKSVTKQLKVFKSSIIELNIKEIREGLDQLASMSIFPGDVNYEQVNAGGVPVDWITVIIEFFS